MDGSNPPSVRRADAPAEHRTGGVSLRVMGGQPGGLVRKSSMGRRRAAALIIIHVLIIGHVIQWMAMGTTVSPIEPSETMYTLSQGYINAGAVFFASALLASLVFGRFVCGWGCHLVAYQDLCAWLMKRIGIQPKPFRSRLLVFAPLMLALYMFVWPTVFRLWHGAPRPELHNHLITSDFWATFPGATIAVLTVFVCGFAVVYFLGAKGFCTYACPYGGFFGLVDSWSPGRIRVTDACAHCGHCTAVCTSNVRVSEEVKSFGMVVDAGCMKCMDCVSVCPNDALYFGFGLPSIWARRRKMPRPRYDFNWTEEIVLVAVFVASLLTFRGLYGRIPLLMAMGMAGITAFLAVKLIQLVRMPNVRLQNLQLRRGGRLTGAGRAFAVVFAVWLAFTGHSAIIHAQTWRSRQALTMLRFAGGEWGNRVWQPGFDWKANVSRADVHTARAAASRLEWTLKWGLWETPETLENLVWLYVALDRLDDAERTVRHLIARNPELAEPHRGLAGILRKAGATEAAERSYSRALLLDPSHEAARRELGDLFVENGRFTDAEAHYRTAAGKSSTPVYWRLELSRLLIRLGRTVEAVDMLERVSENPPANAEDRRLLGMLWLEIGEPDRGIEQLRRSLEFDSTSADAHYNLGVALLGRRALREAIGHLRAAAELRPDWALAHYNLAVAAFMSGDVAAALPSIQTATRLDPADADAWGFCAVVLRELGRDHDARIAEQQAAARRTRPTGGSRFRPH